MYTTVLLLRLDPCSLLSSLLRLLSAHSERLSAPLQQLRRVARARRVAQHRRVPCGDHLRQRRLALLLQPVRQEGVGGV